MKTTILMNKFHNNECQVPVAGTYETNEDQTIVLIDSEEVDKAGKKLCGMENCSCGSLFPSTLYDGEMLIWRTSDN